MGPISNWKLLIHKLKWRRSNVHNYTHAANIFDAETVTVGNMTYGSLNVMNLGRGRKLKIGNYCSIGPNVTFILNAEHDMSNISTFPFKVRTLGKEEYEAVSKGDIVVGDDVWICSGVTILSGVQIGQGAVIAAGALVTKDVPPYAVVGGVPVKVIKYRFEPDIIDELMKVDYSKLSKEMIEEHIDDLYQELTDVKQLDWMPRR